MPKLVKACDVEIGKIYKGEVWVPEYDTLTMGESVFKVLSKEVSEISNLILYSFDVSIIHEGRSIQTCATFYDFEEVTEL
jgi:hypothetical protein